jgi:hypothetical protein
LPFVRLQAPRDRALVDELLGTLGLGELPGHREYAGRVRYRLLPGVW